MPRLQQLHGRFQHAPLLGEVLIILILAPIAKSVLTWYWRWFEIGDIPGEAPAKPVLPPAPEWWEILRRPPHHHRLQVTSIGVAVMRWIAKSRAVSNLWVQPREGWIRLTTVPSKLRWGGWYRTNWGQSRCEEDDNEVALSVSAHQRNRTLFRVGCLPTMTPCNCCC